MKRKLSDYLPDFARECAELRGIAAGEEGELTAAWRAADALLDDQFVTVAGREGLTRWERILGLTPKGTDSLDARRGAILARLNERLPYTLPRLRELLETLCGAGNATATVTDYTLTVRVALPAKGQFGAVVSLLERVAPCHLRLEAVQCYNTHRDLGRFPHGALTQWTYHQLRNEVLPNGNENSPLRLDKAL